MSEPSSSAEGTEGIVTIGDTGPGGGVVFYDSGSTQPWGRYLEAAPAGWIGYMDPRLSWSKGRWRRIRGADGTAIGTGAANSAAILAACSGGAAPAARGYSGGGLTDWFLPSKDELDALHEQQGIVGGCTPASYWSSSQAPSGAAWLQNFASGEQHTSRLKYYMLYVRPVRAF